ncbi:MAG: GreA/GreB family elongation factor, partial [Victivallales bacterium]|nr:GreA/GreB family elongation factor [Victivallales bacterium]
VKPTDFSSFPAEVAGIATQTELSYADGTREIYTILGEWDQNEELHVISSLTGMAQALQGAKPNDVVQVPTVSGKNVDATVLTVSPLPESIRIWINEKTS